MSIVLFENKKDCCGCWACYNICPKSAISMQQDNEGFNYPVINNDLCVACGLCQRVCPIKTAVQREEDTFNQKHIGIINLQYTENYGAVIAAAVLESVVRNIVGAEYIVETFKLNPYFPFKNRFEFAKDKAKSLGGWKFYFNDKFKHSQPTNADKLRSLRFTSFRFEFLNESRTYQNADEIKKSPVNYAAFITGSDIVWAPKKVDNFRADMHFLKFADENQTAIAYAPSIDSVVNKKLKSASLLYKDALRHLDSISVREKSSVDFLQSLTAKKVYECCDPAFLVEPEYYDKMISAAEVKEDKAKFIYVYILEINDEIVEYANKLAKEKNLKICYYSKFHKNYSVNSEDCTSDGPAEFLYRLRNAEYVLTNSFHCVVFSLLFKKQFLSFTRSKISIKSTDLLDKFNLSERIITSDNKIGIDKPIDFDKVDEVIKNMKNSSLDYLKSALRLID